MNPETLSLNKPERKTEKKSGDLAVEHISKGLTDIELKLRRDKFWGRLREVFGSTFMLIGAITLAVEVIDPSFKMPANLREFLTLENMFISTQLFGGLSIFCGGSEKIKEAVTNACRKKAEILKPYLKLPQ